MSYRFHWLRFAVVYLICSFGLGLMLTGLARMLPQPVFNIASSVLPVLVPAGIEGVIYVRQTGRVPEMRTAFRLILAMTLAALGAAIILSLSLLIGRAGYAGLTHPGVPAALARIWSMLAAGLLILSAAGFLIASRAEARRTGGTRK